MEITIDKQNLSPRIKKTGTFENNLPTDNYEVTITIGLKPTNEFIPPFSKDIIVISNNNMTGFQVDIQREIEIQSFLNQINQ